MPYPAAPGITGSACTLAAPHTASAVANKVAGLIARRRGEWVCERLAGFIETILREMECGVGWPVDQIDLLASVVGGPSRPLALTATTAKYQTPDESVENR